MGEFFRLKLKNNLILIDVIIFSLIFLPYEIPIRRVIDDDTLGST